MLLLALDEVIIILKEEKMAKIPIIANNYIARSTYLESIILPNSYMEDFTIQGFVVERIDEARALLVEDGYTLADEGASANILIECINDMQSIQSLFERHGIAAQLMDIADTIYQAW